MYAQIFPVIDLVATGENIRRMRLERGLSVDLNDDLTEAEGIAYCQATLVNDVDGQDVMTTNYVRYADRYVKIDGNWYIKRRRTTFLISDKHVLNG